MLTSDLLKIRAPLDRAVALVLLSHTGQKDKAGQPYIGHLIRVAGRATEEKRQVVALLHDIVEDTNVTLDYLRNCFDSEIVDAIDAISRRAGESYKTYIRRCKLNPLARRVKFNDLRDNLRRDRGKLSPDMEKGRKLYWEAISILDVRTDVSN